MSAITCSAQFAHSQLPTKSAADESRSPMALAPAQLALVSGGAPKGGWLLAQDSGGYVLDGTCAPKGGW